MLSMDHYTYWKEGVAEGRAEGKAEVVVQMLREKLSLEMIAKLTNLTLDEIMKIGKAHALI